MNISQPTNRFPALSLHQEFSNNRENDLCCKPSNTGEAKLTFKIIEIRIILKFSSPYYIVRARSFFHIVMLSSTGLSIQNISTRT